MTALPTNSPMRSARHRRFGTGWAGAAVLLVIAMSCLVTLSVSLDKYEGEAGDELAAHQAPNWSQPMGTDALGRSLLWRCLLGGAISLGIGAQIARSPSPLRLGIVKRR